MSYNYLINFIETDNFVIQDISKLIEGFVYYFKQINDKNIYKGKFKIIYYNQKTETRFIFEDVEIYNGSSFQHFTYSLSTPFIDKIYYL